MADTVGTSSQCSHYRESVVAGVYFSQSSVNYFCLGFSCCLYYRGVRHSKVSERRELTVRGKNCLCERRTLNRGIITIRFN